MERSGKLEIITLGGAKTDLNIQKDLLSWGIKVVEGYGLTETTGIVSMDTPKYITPGTSGKLIPGIKLKISKDKEILLFLGKNKGEVVSGAIFIFWQNMCFYHHSGSLSKYNKIPVSYLLQWEAIKEAKNRGCKTYNFWGIAPGIENESDAQKSRHPWAGLSLFKMGFGGYKKEYVKTQDFIISSKYWLNYIIEIIRKRKRNL